MIHRLEQSGSLKCLSPQQVLEFSERIRKLAQAGALSVSARHASPSNHGLGQWLVNVGS